VLTRDGLSAGYTLAAADHLRAGRTWDDARLVNRASQLLRLGARYTD
jgi:hypothetical protein